MFTFSLQETVLVFCIFHITRFMNHSWQHTYSDTLMGISPYCSSHTPKVYFNSVIFSNSFVRTMSIKVRDHTKILNKDLTRWLWIWVPLLFSIKIHTCKLKRVFEFFVISLSLIIRMIDNNWYAYIWFKLSL